MKKSYLYLGLYFTLIGMSIPNVVNAEMRKDNCNLLNSWNKAYGDTCLNVKEYDDNGKITK